MFCAFDGPPKIVRLHGRGEVLMPGSAAFEQLRPRFPEYPGTRAIVHAELTRISDSCGYAVPRLSLVEPRDALLRWAEKRGEEQLVGYRREHNSHSLDGLPALATD
jgi:hypothetical protein